MKKRKRRVVRRVLYRTMSLNECHYPLSTCLHVKAQRQCRIYSLPIGRVHVTKASDYDHATNASVWNHVIDMVIADIHRLLWPFVYDLVPSLENLYKPACLALLVFFTTSLHYHHYQTKPTQTNLIHNVRHWTSEHLRQGWLCSQGPFPFLRRLRASYSSLIVARL